MLGTTNIKNKLAYKVNGYIVVN